MAEWRRRGLEPLRSCDAATKIELLSAVGRRRVVPLRFDGRISQVAQSEIERSLVLTLLNVLATRISRDGSALTDSRSMACNSEVSEEDVSPSSSQIGFLRALAVLLRQALSRPLFARRSRARRCDRIVMIDESSESCGPTGVIP